MFLRFLVVGLLNTAFGYAVYAVFLFVGLHFTLALALATILGVFFNFHTARSLVFEQRDNRRLLRFVGVYVVVYLANAWSIAVLRWYGLEPYTGGALVILPMAALAFILNRRYVFFVAQADERRPELR